MRHDLPFLLRLANLALAGCMALLAVSARAQPQEAVAKEEGQGAARLSFDIPRQPLHAALEQYGLRTGLPVFFDATLVAGRESSAVRAEATPAQALHALLQGTGLVADYSGTGTSTAFVLKRAPAGAAGEDAATAPAAPPDRRYDGLVQTRIWEAFCANPRTVPGGYRAAMRFVIDGTGRIANAFLLHTSGDRARDGAILDTMRQIRIDRPPPPDMAQPLTMLILPRSQTPGLECPAHR
jgi:hypothetical protein